MVDTNKCLLKHDTVIALTAKLDSIDEHRFLNACLVDSWRRVELDEREYYEVNIGHYAERSGRTLGQAYSELKAMLTRGMEKIEVNIGGGWTWVTSFVYDYKYSDEDVSIKVRWNKDIIQYISGDMPKGEFFVYDKRMDVIPSSKRYVLCELIQKNLHKMKVKGEWVISYKKLREFLCLEDSSYPKYGDFYKRIIKPTLFDIARIQEEYIIVNKRNVGLIFKSVSREEFERAYGGV